MTWSSTGTHTGTDTNLSGITAVTGVVVNVSSSGHKTYIVPSTISVLYLQGTALSWDSDYETLVTSDSTRVEQNAGCTVTIGKSTVVNGKTRWSKGTGLIMNRQQGSPFINTSACNWWIKAGTSLALGGKVIINGSRVVSGGGFFCGNSTTPTNNFVTFELNGGAILQNIHTGWNMQMIRCFCEPAGININKGSIDGRTLGGLPFSNAGWGTLGMSLEFGNFQCDGNGAAPPVTVPNAELLENVSSFDYAYVASGNDKTKINKYIFNNSDIGSGLRTLGQTGTTWRLGVVEITKDLIFNVVNAAGTAVEDAVTYLKLNGASINPSTGSRYAGIDDYMTPRVYIAGTSSTGLTSLQTVLYAVAQGYATDATNAGQALTMDALTTRTNDVSDGYIWSYDHLVGQPTAAMRGTGTLTQSWTLFNDLNVTLSRTAAIAKLASSFSVDIPNKRVTITANSTLSDLYDAMKAFKCSTTTAQIEAPVIGKTIAMVAGELVSLYTDWNLTINSGVTLSGDDKYKQISLTGTGLVTVDGAIAVPYQDADGLRVTVTNLDPEGFGITWYLRHRPTGGSTWTNVSGTGNTALILLAGGAYDVQVRAPGYEWESALVLDTEVSLSLNAGLRYHVSANNTPQYEMPFDSTLEAIFQYNATEMKVSVANTTAGILQPGFAELYRATQRIQHLSALVWTWTAPVTANSTSQKILIPTGNPISMYLTDSSTNSVKITCPVIHADTGQSADDRIRGNADGFSIILGSPATAESAGLQAGIVAALGGANYDESTASLVVLKDLLSAVQTLNTAIKGKTDNLPAQPAAVGDAMTLTTAYDAAKTASTQTSVDALSTDLTSIKGTGYDSTKHNLVAIKRQASLAAALSA